MSIRTSLFAAVVLALAGLPPGQYARAQDAVPGGEISPAQLELVNYAYSVFPQQLAAVERQAALAEYEAAYWRQRVSSYRPTRSFGVYSATYNADQQAQLQAYAAQQNAECARQQIANLWRERQAVVGAMMLNASNPR